MIYVVEIPHTGKPKAWFAFNADDFERKVRAGKVGDPRTIFLAQSPREQLAALGLDPDAPDAPAAAPDIFARAEQHGWDTPWYRADYLLEEPGAWEVEPVEVLEAYAAAASDGLASCRIYLSDQAAETALYKDPLYQGREGFYAHIALREQLIALEVIADDL